MVQPCCMPDVSRCHNAAPCAPRSADAQPADTRAAAVPPLGSAYESNGSGASQLLALCANNNVVSVKARALPMRCTECSASVFDLGRCACLRTVSSVSRLDFALVHGDATTTEHATKHLRCMFRRCMLHDRSCNLHVRSPVGSCGHDTCSITQISTAFAILHES